MSRREDRRGSLEIQVPEDESSAANTLSQSMNKDPNRPATSRHDRLGKANSKSRELLQNKSRTLSEDLKTPDNANANAGGIDGGARGEPLMSSTSYKSGGTCSHSPGDESHASHATSMSAVSRKSGASHVSRASGKSSDHVSRTSSNI